MPPSNLYNSPLSTASTKVGTPQRATRPNFPQAAPFFDASTPNMAITGRSAGSLPVTPSTHDRNVNIGRSGSGPRMSDYSSITSELSNSNSVSNGAPAAPRSHKQPLGPNLVSSAASSSQRRSIYADYPPSSSSAPYPQSSYRSGNSDHRAGASYSTSSVDSSRTNASSSMKHQQRQERKSCKPKLLNDMDFAYRNHYGGSGAGAGGCHASNGNRKSVAAAGARAAGNVNPGCTMS